MFVTIINKISINFATYYETLNTSIVGLNYYTFIRHHSEACNEILIILLPGIIFFDHICNYIYVVKYSLEQNLRMSVYKNIS